MLTTMRRILGTAFALSLFAAAAWAQDGAAGASAPSGKAGKLQGIMVWRLEGKSGVADDAVDSISGYITSEVERLSGHKVISEADIRTVLKGEEMRQKCGAENTSCVVEIGAALGVPEAVSGDLGKLGSFWLLNLRRINVRTAAVIGRSSRNIEGSIDDLIRALPAAVGELFGQAPSGAEGKAGALESGARPAHYPLSPYSKAAYATFFSGLGLVAFGGIASWQAVAAQNALKESGDWAASGRNHTWSGLAVTSYVLGGAAMATGIILWAVAPSDRAWWESRHLGLAAGVSPQGASVSLSGRW